MNKLEKGIKKLVDRDRRRKIHSKERSFILLNVPTDTVKEIDAIIKLYMNAKRRVILGCISNEPIKLKTQEKMIKALEIVVKAKMSKKTIPEMLEEIYEEFEETGFVDPKDIRYIG